ncbi:MAG: phytoene desaturase family protein [Segniliparus sp.]|uniref:phytoene desaturase family protein n=1 Tax=Segniliparus sp. TaxID=2804064 RepID=UPI003F3AF029
MMGERARYDAIVIGAGLGGLAAAAYLAANGRSVLVLERYKVVGGSSHVFRRRGRWEFEVGVHYLEDAGEGGIWPTLLGGVGLRDRVEFLPMDAGGFDTILGPDVELRVPRGWELFRENLLKAFPREERAIDRYLKLSRAVFVPDVRMRGDYGTARRVLAAGWASPVAMAPLAAVLVACGFSPRAILTLSVQCGTYTTTPDVVPFGWHVSYFYTAIEKGAWFPRGGGQVLSANLLQVVEANGGAVRTGAAVAKILVEGRRAVGVRLADGSCVHSSVVVSDADIKHTLLDLVGPEHLPAGSAVRAKALRMGWPFVNTYFGLERDLRGTPNTNYYVIPSWEKAESLFSLVKWSGSLLRGAHRRSRSDWLDDFDTNMPAFIHSGTVRDPQNLRTAPSGHSSVEAMTLVPKSPALWGVRDIDPDNRDYRKDPVYREVKDRLASAMLDRIDRVYPGAREQVVWSEAATPATQRRYTRTTDGAAFGIAVSPDQYGPTRPGTRTAVDGLFLAGCSTRWGPGTTGAVISGVHAASAVLGRDLLSEIKQGAVFGDPRKLPSRAADWDPLAVARAGTADDGDRDATPIALGK